MSLLHPRKYAQIEPEIGVFSEAIEPFRSSQQTTARAICRGIDPPRKELSAFSRKLVSYFALADG
jgi:hypothetical protein